LRKAAFAHTPDCEYDEWIKVGMQLHQGTEGDGAGFDVWRDWSKGITRAEYPGDVVLKSHWLSFNSDMPNAATGEALAAELPTETEDLEIMTEAVAPAQTPKANARQAALDNLVKRFVFVIWDQQYFDTERNALIGDKAIKHILTPYMPKKNDRECDPVDLLMRSKAKDAVEAIAFYPGAPPIFEDSKRRYANAWYDNSPEPIEPMADERKRIEWLFDRIDDPAYREWFRQFLAHIVQRPAIKIRSAPLLWSKTQGNGKSTLVGTIPSLLVGVQFYTEVNEAELNSDHNDYLIGKWLVSLAEFRAGTRGERSTISKKVERWIADNTLSIHPKGTKGYPIPNHLVVTASTNESDAALIDVSDRKWAIHHFTRNGVDVQAMTDAEKVWIFGEFLDTPRAAAVLRHYFLNVAITTFNPNADALKTASRDAMIKSSIGRDEEVLRIAFEQRSEPFTREVVITADVAEWVGRQRIAVSVDRIGKMLCGEPFYGTPHQWRVGPARYRGIIFDNKWIGASGAAIMKYINGDDESVAVQDDLLL
jgi:hypothetical protein